MTAAWQTVRERAARPLRQDSRAAMWSIAMFWAFYLIVTTARSFTAGFQDPLLMIPHRFGVVLVGALITYGVFLVLRPLERFSLGWRMGAYLVAAIPASGAYSLWNYVVFYLISPLDFVWEEPGEKPMTMSRVVIESMFGWYWFFCAWAAFYLALRYAAEVRNAERRMAVWRAEAQSAQIRALRYQVNPHFLFNTLNSLSSLILRQRTDDAEQMLMNLSAYLRTTLSGDPEALVPLSEEIEQQRLYLEVERVRFGERLRFDLELAPGTGAVLVPPMILQPILENTIRYAVSAAEETVHLCVCAERRGGRLHLIVRDDGPAAPGPFEGGLGTGLANVRARLAAAYGEAADMTAGPGDAGGFVVDMSWPLPDEQA